MIIHNANYLWVAVCTQITVFSPRFLPGGGLCDKSGGTMLNATNGDPGHVVVKYVEEYLDLVESLPFDLQRSVSLMKEIDARYQGKNALCSPIQIIFFGSYIYTCTLTHWRIKFNTLQTDLDICHGQSATI